MKRIPTRKPTPASIEEVRTWIDGLYEESSAAAKEAERLYTDHFFDQEQEKIPSQHISGTKKNLAWITNERHRAIYVLSKSGCFDESTIGRILNISRNTVNSTLKKYAGEAV